MFCTKDDIELESFHAVAIDERTESEVSEGKLKIEIEDNYLLANCQFFKLIIWLRQKEYNFSFK